MPKTAAIFDLDRTVLRGSSAPVIQRHLKEAGLAGRDFPGERLFQTTYELFGESGVAMRAARTQSGAKAGWKVAAVAAIAEKIADELVDQVMPFVPSVLAKHRKRGDTLVLATGSNQATIQALADRLGFDHVIATRWAVDVDGETYTGEIDGGRLLGDAKRDAVLAWAAAEKIDLSKSSFYTDSRFDIDLLNKVGRPVAVNPDAGLALIATVRRWPIRFLDKSPGVMKLAGREMQDWMRPLSRPSLDPMADIQITGLENIPADGPAILVFNHRSYYDSTAVGYVLAASNRAARFLGKKEVFDVPVFGALATAAGGIRVDRGTGSDEPLMRAVAALEGGEMIAMAPQGTIPRGPSFFDPELKGRWGAARLAQLTGAKVVPVGLWGTEHVWPRSSRAPRFVRPGSPKPVVTVSVGKPFVVKTKDTDAATKTIMKKLVEQLPPEAKLRRIPTAEELARTYPAGYKGDPTQEGDRRPGTDTTEG